jgi:hypothetical protein
MYTDPDPGGQLLTYGIHRIRINSTVDVSFIDHSPSHWKESFCMVIVFSATDHSLGGDHSLDSSQGSTALAQVKPLLILFPNLHCNKPFIGCLPAFLPVLRIRYILARIRIRGSVPLTNGSGSCHFRQ